MAPKIDLAEYLWRRLAEIGLRSLHGVPGDYNLTMLDYLESTGIHWVGNANELNSGYAADAYARIKGIGALVTSFGVGELSAINAIGGAYAERSPVVHVVGTPPVAAQRAGACLHHSLGDGNFRVFADMYKSVTVAQANLVDAESAPRMIDTTLAECLRQSRPVYIELPTDMVRLQVPAPESAINLSIPSCRGMDEDRSIDEVVARIQSCKRPMILVDGPSARFGITQDLNALVEVTGFPTLTTPCGKGIINETLPNFHGVHLGSAAEAAHQSWVNERDLVLHFCPLYSDTNTFGFTAIPDPIVAVTFEPESIRMGSLRNHTADGCPIPIKSAVSKLLGKLQTLETPTTDGYPNECPSPKVMHQCLPRPDDSSIVDQSSFWLLMSNFLKQGDIVLTETGTASYGGHSLALPKDTVVINSTIWLSIGFMLAACQGAALAQRDMSTEGARRSGRTILFEGEGSLQMTAQSISDMIRNRLDVIIFVLNNNGYTIERLINGFAADYNDVQAWRNLEAPSYFGAPTADATYPVRTFPVDNWGQLRGVLERSELQDGKGFNMVEVKMDMADAPRSLKLFAEYLVKRNSGGA
ncbi:hypothetical protein N8I77_008785 [Diaporthe amygdali]|uniref:Pyruvate decarboxylase n=1 Tax=Phomopsis amygdali TaxID=1214568 RepID=A0AAD9S9S2_PHOAM|nr:hypothetical protein N8I77_008785 [Diaporthe amygdali]